jgi:hypothetical protein
MSFFARFNRPGATPISREKVVVKTVRSPAEPKSGGSAPTKKPARRSDEVKEKPRITTNSTSSPTLNKASSSASLKRKHGSPPKPAVVKRSVSSSDLLKPPTPRDSVSPARGHRAISSSRSPLSQRLESSDEESSDDEQHQGQKASKRVKAESDNATDGATEESRRLVHPSSFRKAEDLCDFVHAEKIANLKMKQSGKGISRGMDGPVVSVFRDVLLTELCVIVFKKEQLLNVGLRYPGIPQCERCLLTQTHKCKLLGK